MMCSDPKKRMVIAFRAVVACWAGALIMLAGKFLYVAFGG